MIQSLSISSISRPEAGLVYSGPAGPGTAVVTVRAKGVDFLDRRLGVNRYWTDRQDGGGGENLSFSFDPYHLTGPV